MARNCRFRKQNGQRCGADPQSGKDLCVFHDPARASEGHRARRAGGLRRTRVAAVLAPETPDHPPRSTKEVSDLLAESINHLRKGQLDPKVANAVGYLASVLLRSLEQGRIEERLAQLERIIGKTEPTGGVFEFRSTTEIANARQDSTAAVD
jgi:hypothetical protein